MLITKKIYICDSCGLQVEVQQDNPPPIKWTTATLKFNTTNQTFEYNLCSFCSGTDDQSIEPDKKHNIIRKTFNTLFQKEHL